MVESDSDSNSSSCSSNSSSLSNDDQTNTKHTGDSNYESKKSDYSIKSKQPKKVKKSFHKKVTIGELVNSPNRQKNSAQKENEKMKEKSEDDGAIVTNNKKDENCENEKDMEKIVLSQNDSRNGGSDSSSSKKPPEESAVQEKKPNEQNGDLQEKLVEIQKDGEIQAEEKNITKEMEEKKKKKNIVNVSGLLRSQSLENSKPKNQARRSESRERWRKKRKHSRSRSNSYKRKTNEKRSEKRENPPQQRTRSTRSESIERRRQERKRRHAEREEREKAKRRRSDERRKSPHGSSRDVDTKGKENIDNATVTDPKAKITEPQKRTVDLLTSRTGGAYIPPAKLRLMQAEITDKASAAYQRIAWEALKKSIHGYINKVNVDNIAPITRDLLKENIVRGRGLLCRSIIQAQAASPTFTHVYAALVSIINSKFPNIGELLLKRLVIQFKRAFRRSDKPVCLSSTRFIAHLINQRVAHEILALEILTLLVETPNDDSVEVAIAFLKECGMKLSEVSSKGIGAIFEMLKNILHEGNLDKRVQYMIEVVFQVRKDGFKDHPSVIEALELVEEDDQFTHLLMLDDAIDPEEILNAFKFDQQYAMNEDKYKGLSRGILGSDASSDEDGDKSSRSGTDGDSSADSDNDEEDEDDGDGNLAKKSDDIIDNTETNLIALRRTIYLTINSSLEYEECAHKLMKMQLKPGQEIELCHMFLDCCAEQRTYEKFYGLLAQRFCSINKIYIEPFEEIFRDTYQTTHRLDTNRLRNVSKFFAHLLFTDAISWDVLECIKLNEDETTSSSRIFIKILFQELAEYMGLRQLNKRLKDEVLVESLTGLFPKDNPRNTRFSINFFTSIGLGGLTDELRQFLKNAPKSVPAINAETLANKPIKHESSSETSSSSSDTSSSNSSTSSSSDDSSESDSSSSNSTKSRTDSSSTASDKKKSKRKINTLMKKNKKEASTISKKNEGKNRAEIIRRSGKNEKIKNTKKPNKKESSSSSSSSSTSSSRSQSSSSSSSSSSSCSHSSDSSNSSSSESHNNAGKLSTKQQWNNKKTKKEPMPAREGRNDGGSAANLKKVRPNLVENGLHKEDEKERERELIRRREEREKRHRVREKYEETYRQRERERAARERKRTRTRTRTRTRSRSRLLDKKRSSLRGSRSHSSHDKRNQRERERDRDRDRDRERERDREHDRDRDRDREHDRVRDRERDREHDRERDREHDRERGREHDREREREHDRQRNREHDRERDRDRDRERDIRKYEKYRERSRTRTRSRQRKY